MHKLAPRPFKSKVSGSSNIAHFIAAKTVNCTLLPVGGRGLAVTQMCGLIFLVLVAYGYVN